MRLMTQLKPASHRMLILVGAIIFTQAAVAQDARVDSEALIGKYCAACHNSTDFAGGVDLEFASADSIAERPRIGEKMIKRLRAGMMPPAGKDRPDYDTVQKLAKSVEENIDKIAATKGPHPLAPGLHRLNRTEYTNAIRDLLALDIDAAKFLPSDDSSHGFDNMAGTLTTSPALMEAYLSAAGNISRLAIGTETAPTLAVFDAPHDTSQNEYVEGLPFGTRGGMLIEHEFPADGEYTLTVKGMTGYFTAVLGNVGGEQLEVTVDGKRVYMYDWDKEIATKRSDGGKTPALTIKAGFHRIGVAFLATSDLPDTGIDKSFQRTMNSPGAISGHTFYPHVGQVFIEGPFKGAVATDTQSRRTIFQCYPKKVSEEDNCARKIITTLTTKAFRRPASDADITVMTAFYRSGREQGGKFDSGIEAVIQRILIDPDFIYRAEIEPAKVVAGTPYQISDLELASRLSFFLWSSIPDNELINLASANKLHEPRVLKQQLDRMIADPRSQALVQNFTGQWLNIRGLAAREPTVNLFPDFDSTLRDAFKREIELFFSSIIQEDRSITDLLTADYTFVNERLAKHYGIPDIYGPQFRRVQLGPDQDMRRGLLGKGALLTITSEAARTSPVKRGKWFLQTFLGVSPPDPPPGVVIKLDQQAGETPKTMRARLQIHSTNPTCATCHKMFEPLGLAMENFDPVGEWRTIEAGTPIDSVGVVTDGTRVEGIKGLRDLAVRKREMFEEVVTENLLTYAIGRGLDYNDMPLVRSLTHNAAKDNYKFSSLIMGVVQSPAFTMNMKSAPVSLSAANSMKGE
jgi:Protein of unknown function (DUF1592)/Protein of unknown function (DUF1588)/Protein of unknown function (DUF1587)/Protein of unknown function (DUF1585)/Protein of unknown function (DUF1595)